MNYKTDYVRNPGGHGAGKLTNYVSRGPNGMADGDAVVVDQRGNDVVFDDVERFRSAVAESEMSRQHCFAFADDHDSNELLDKSIEALDGKLDGEYIVACHQDSDNPHIHVAQAGTESDLYMDTGDIGNVRSAVANAVGEEIGDGYK